jgi:hypothetical protein
MATPSSATTPYRVVFNKLPINVFDNTNSYGIRLFLNNPQATFSTPVTDPSYAGRIWVYNNAIHAFENSADLNSNDHFVQSGIDVTDAIERLGLENANVSASDFRVVVFQHDQEVNLSDELQLYFKPELVKVH